MHTIKPKLSEETPSVLDKQKQRAEMTADLIHIEEKKNIHKPELFSERDGERESDESVLSLTADLWSHSEGVYGKTRPETTDY